MSNQQSEVNSVRGVVVTKGAGSCCAEVDVFGGNS